MCVTGIQKKGEGKRAGKIFEDRMVKYPEKYYESIKHFSILLKKMSVIDLRISANSQQGEHTHRDTRTTKHVVVKPLNTNAKEKTLRRKQRGEKQVYCSRNWHSSTYHLLPLPLFTPSTQNRFLVSSFFYLISPVMRPFSTLFVWNALSSKMMPRTLVMAVTTRTVSTATAAVAAAVVMTMTSGVAVVMAMTSGVAVVMASMMTGADGYGGNDAGDGHDLGGGGGVDNGDAGGAADDDSDDADDDRMKVIVY